MLPSATLLPRSLADLRTVDCVALSLARLLRE